MMKREKNLNIILRLRLLICTRVSDIVTEVIVNSISHHGNVDDDVFYAN